MRNPSRQLHQSSRYSKQEASTLAAYIESIRGYVAKEAQSEESWGVSEDSFS